MLVLTAFFDSAQEAVQYLNTGVPTEVVEHVKTPTRREAKFWHGELWEIYVKCGGQITKMAAVLGMDKKYLQERMLAQGLPSLHNVSSSSNWRALVRLHQGESFRRACELEKIGEEELEVLLRTVNPKVVGLVLEILEYGDGECRFDVSNSLKRQQLPTCAGSVRTVPQKPIDQTCHHISGLTAFGKNKNWNSLEEMKAA